MLTPKTLGARGSRPLVLFAAVTTLLGLVSVASASEPSNWSIVESRNSAPIGTDNYPQGSTCLSESDCWSVGNYRKGGTSQSLIQHFDGSEWRLVEAPSTGATQTNLLRDIACNSSTDCWAVGSFDNGSAQQTLIQHWDGDAWSIKASPNTSPTQSNFLTGIECTSSSACWAVGSYYGSANIQTLMLRWNGASWSIVTSPNTSTSQANFLNGVACPSVGQCWAVGSTTATGIGERTLILRWDGASWAVASSPNLGAGHNMLNAATCFVGQCWAVGSAMVGAVRQTLVLRWEGLAWTAVLTPNGSATSNSLQDVSCAAAASCFAVGNQESSGTRSLMLKWDGSSWTSEDPGIAVESRLVGVTCPTSVSCVAVGSKRDGSLQKSLALAWDSFTWTETVAANGMTVTANTLLGIACVTEDACWSVSSYDSGIALQTSIQFWNGATWSLVPSPNTSSTASNILYDVACASLSDCWAAGYAMDAGGFQPLMLHWDGVTWAIVASPSATLVGNNFLHDITCRNSNDCWAVGFYDSGIGYNTLIEHWDGTAWTIVSSPNVEGSIQNRLYGITCAPAANRCWAAGRHHLDNGQTKNLILTWDGSGWAIQASPHSSEQESNTLLAAECISASDCWAVGTRSEGFGHGRNLMLHWDGTDWTSVEVPDPADATYNYVFLRSIDCVNASTCKAVGFYSSNGVNRTMVLDWNGSSWKVDRSPVTSADEGNVLIGVACPTAATCWASGYYVNESGIYQTMIQRYSTPVNLAPVARIAADVVVGAAPLKVRFDSSSSSDPNPADSIDLYRFDAGDGSAISVQSSPVFEHIYSAPGSFSATVSVTDDRGMESELAASLSISVSEAAPRITAPVNGDALPTSSVMVRGDARPGATVDLFDLGVLSGTAFADSSGDWTVQLNLAEGAHVLTSAARVSGGGHGSPSAATNFVVDTTAPTAPVVVQPAQDSTVAGTYITMSGTGEPGAMVAVLRAGTVIGSAAVKSNGSWSVAKEFVSGEQTIEAHQIDRAGNAGPAGPTRRFNVDASLAATQILSPLQSSIVGARNVPVVGRAAPGALIELTLIGTPGISATATADASGQWDSTIRLSDGEHTIRAQQVSNGNVSEYRTFIVSSGVPVISSPTADAVVSGRVTVEGAAAPGAVVTVKTASSSLASRTADSSGRWSMTVALPDGAHTIVANAKMTSKTTEDSEKVRFTVDSIGPSITVKSSDSIMGPPLAGTVEIRGTAVDDRSNVERIHVRYVDSLGRAVVGSPSCTGCATEMSAAFLDKPNLGPGYWTAVARAFDAAGNASYERAVSFTVIG